MTIPSRLQEAMDRAGIKSQSELARRSGVPQPTINRILKGVGRQGPATETLKKLGDACDVPFQWLADGTSTVRLTSARSDRSISLNVRIPKDVDPAIEATLKDTAEKVLAILARSDSQEVIIATADRLAQAMIGMFQPDAYLVEERMDRLRSIRKMLREGEWLTAAEINAAQEDPPAQRSLPASEWKRRGRIFSVNHDGVDYYPRYALDAAYRPLPIIRELLKELGAESDPWKIAAWFHFPNSRVILDTLGGRHATSPKDALSQRDKLLDAARFRRRTYVA